MEEYYHPDNKTLGCYVVASPYLVFHVCSAFVPFPSTLLLFSPYLTSQVIHNIKFSHNLLPVILHRRLRFTPLRCDCFLTSH